MKQKLKQLENGFTMLKNKISGNDTFFTDLDNLKNENEELKQKNSQLEQSLRELEIIKAENTTLKEIVYRIEHHIEIIPKCPICGNRIPYTSKYGTYCSKKC